jgi:hypothetical protein
MGSLDMGLWSYKRNPKDRRENGDVAAFVSNAETRRQARAVIVMHVEAVADGFHRFGFVGLFAGEVDGSPNEVESDLHVPAFAEES